MVAASYRHCFESASAAAGRPLSEDELIRFFSAAQGRINGYVRTGMDARSAAQRAGRDLAIEEGVAAAIAKRNAGFNVLARQALDARVIPGQEARSVREVLTGSQRAGRDAGNSIDAQRHGIRDQFLGPMIADLRKSGLLRVIRRRDKAFDRDVARELWRLDDPASAPPSGNAHAAATAKILHEAQEAARAMQNGAGAWIGKLDHYITRQNHDMMKVRGNGSAAAFATWRDAILPKLDPRTFDRLEDPVAEQDDFLKHVWSNLAAGVHETSTNASLEGFKGPGNLAKRASAERVLHFNSADDWFDYNQQFGHGGVLDGVVHGLDRASRDVALMRTLGTNPEAMYRGWVDRLQGAARDRGDFAAVDKLKGDWNDRILDVVTGQANLPAGATWAKIGTTIRTMQALSKLGGVVLSSFPDLAVNAAMLRHNGVPLLDAYARQVIGLLPKSTGTREVADQLAVGIDGLVGNIMQRFKSEDGAMGKMSRAVDLFHKANLLTWWTDSLKSAGGLMLSNNLGRNAGREFGELPSRMQTSLRRYGIEAAEWDAVRGGAATAADGNVHLLPESTNDPVLRTKLSTYITDQVREGMTEPTAGTSAQGRLGLQAGTVGGEFVRLLMQFKTYPLTFINRTLGREFSRDGMDVAGIAHVIVATTLLGYVSMTLKELAKGRDPREPHDAGGYAKTVMAAMAQGGGLGIYGDFLFGEANRMGGGFMTSLAGPTFGSLGDAANLFQAIRDGAVSGNRFGDRLGAIGHVLGSEGLQAAKNNAPLLNLFYTRAALDHFIFFRLQEAANPGYLRRYEAKVKKDNNQTFWLSPTSAAR